MTKQKEQQETVRKALEQLLESFQDELDTYRKTLRESRPGDPFAGEPDVTETELDTLIGLIETHSKEIREIEEALKRLKQGRYGVCQECQQEIEEARLAAIPSAVLCVKCQEATEAEEHSRRKAAAAARG